MDFFHSTTKIISRNKGRSAVAASAYISGTKMENTWDGTTHDYTRKRHIIHTEVMLPAHAPPEYADRSLLWNSVEWNEKKANAQLARSIEISLPAELTHEQNIALIRKYVQETFVDKGMCADVAFHDKNDGNPHAHILLTMRPLTADGKWGDKSRLEYILDAAGNRIPAKQKGRWKTRKVSTTDWDDRGNVERWRAAAADTINRALRDAGFTQGFVDPRSYADQGVQRIPMVHEGPDARAMEKRGIPTEVGEKNREIRQQNKLLSQLEARLARLNAWAQYEKKKDELLVAQDEAVSRESLRFKLASNILASSVQPNRKDHRLRDSTGLLSIMHEYNITDAISISCNCTKSETGRLTIVVKPTTIIKALNFYSDRNDDEDFLYQIYAGPLNMDFDYEALQYFRTKLGYTQQQVADAVGTSVRTYQKWEAGSTIPNGFFLLKLLNWLDIRDIQDVVKYK